MQADFTPVSGPWADEGTVDPSADDSPGACPCRRMGFAPYRYLDIDTWIDHSRQFEDPRRASLHIDGKVAGGQVLVGQELVGHIWAGCRSRNCHRVRPIGHNTDPSRASGTWNKVLS